MSDMPASHPHAAAIPDIVINDAIQPFHLSNSPVRGRLVRLGGLADAILSRKALGAAAHLGGQALSLVAGMSAGLKFEGALSLQVKGDGPVSLMVADSTHDGAVRLYMRLTEDDRLRDPPEVAPRADMMFGKGYFAFTIDQGPETDRQQGIVTLEGASLSEMAAHYFATSEQLPTSIRLFSSFQDGKWDAGALLLERIADEGGRERHDAEEDHWETAKTLAATLTAEEVFNPHLTHSALLYRVFGTLGVAASAPRPARFGCRCAREKLLSVLRNFSDDDLDEMAENGVITMSCEFCGVDYRFDRNNIAPDPV